MRIICRLDAILILLQMQLKKGSGGGGTSAATINSASVILKVSKLPAEIAQARFNSMIKQLYNLTDKSMLNIIF